jgi:hypothetical protein
LKLAMDEPFHSTDTETVERLNKLAALFGADGPPDLDEVEGPLHWPDITATDASVEWRELREWVEGLLERFPHLDHHVIPLCWWRHNGHVEALSALRDHERICYADSSPATAAVDWHRAFRDIESRLREWTGTLPCGSSHDTRIRPVRPVGEVDWATFVADDVERRRRAAMRHAVSDE